MRALRERNGRIKVRRKAFGNFFGGEGGFGFCVTAASFVDPYTPIFFFTFFERKMIFEEEKEEEEVAAMPPRLVIFRCSRVAAFECGFKRAVCMREDRYHVE